MNKPLSLLISVSSLLSAGFFLASCGAELGPADGEEEDGTGGGSLAGSGGTGSGGTGTGGGTHEFVSFQTLKDVLSGYRIDRPDYSCASSDCHSGGHDHSDVPLRLVEDEGLYAELTTHVSVKCGNIKVVEPGDPANSALIKVLRGGCDDNVIPPDKPTPRMPFGCEETEWENSCVAYDYIDAIEAWIAKGAPEF